MRFDLEKQKTRYDQFLLDFTFQNWDNILPRANAYDLSKITKPFKEKKPYSIAYISAMAKTAQTVTSSEPSVAKLYFTVFSIPPRNGLGGNDGRTSEYGESQSRELRRDHQKKGDGT
jgi:hypothetical protein